MPFTVNVGPYMGGQFLYGGLSTLGQSLGGGIGKAIEQYQTNQKQDAYNDLIIQHALQNNLITHDDWQKYMGSSRTQKTGIAAGIAANVTSDIQRKQAAALEEQRLASAQYRTQQAAEAAALAQQRKAA